MTIIDEKYDLVRKTNAILDQLFAEQTRLQLEIQTATSRLQALNQQIGQVTSDLAQAKTALKQAL